MVKPIWKARFKVLPTLKKSEKIASFFFQVENRETFVETTYRTISYNQIHPKRKTNDEYAEETLAKLDMDALREIMLKRMVYQKHFGPINIKLDTHPELINGDEFKAKGIKLSRLIEQSVTSSFSILDVGDSIQESQTFWKEARRDKTVEIENDIIRIADWFERSTREQDPLNSLILLWIGFNGLYGKLTELSGQRFKNDCEKFEFTIDKLITDEQAERIVNNWFDDINKLVSYKIMLRYGKEPASLNLGEELNKKPLCEKMIIKKTVRCI